MIERDIYNQEREPTRRHIPKDAMLYCQSCGEDALAGELKKVKVGDHWERWCHDCWMDELEERRERSDCSIFADEEI